MTKSPRAVCNSVKRLLNLRYKKRDRLLEYEVFFLEMIYRMCLPICLFITWNMTQAHFSCEHVKCWMGFKYACNGEIHSKAELTQFCLKTCQNPLENNNDNCLYNWFWIWVEKNMFCIWCWVIFVALKVHFCSTPSYFFTFWCRRQFLFKTSAKFMP